jgi:hypothetical protein
MEATESEPKEELHASSIWGAIMFGLAWGGFWLFSGVCWVQDVLAIGK